MAVKAWDAYQLLCKKLLDDSDYANIKGKMAKKRSGFTKLARFYGVTVKPITEVMYHEGDDWGFDLLVEATLPGGAPQRATGPAATQR